MKSVLFVAFHFPPLQGSTGIHRTLSFCRHLPRHGWQPTVLTASTRAYEQVDARNDDLIPAGIRVVRACALDAKRHLAIRGRYLDVLALPDRYQSWIPTAVLAGLYEILRRRPDVIVSTYPLASAHIIGCALSRLTGIPWVADFRDPMAQPGYPSDRRQHAAFCWIERQVFTHADRVTFTTPSALEVYGDRFPDYPAAQLHEVQNGYEGELPARSGLQGSAVAPRSGPPARINLLHSGTIYREERDPTALLAAVRQLKLDHGVTDADLQLTLRGTNAENWLPDMVKAAGCEDLVKVLPPVNYEQAVAEMAEADGLLLLQGPSCWHQIPAKAYEYISARRPVLALVGTDTDTGRLLSGLAYRHIAALDDPREIRKVLAEFLTALKNRTITLPGDYEVRQHSREERAREFADVLMKAAAARESAQSE